MSLITPYEFKTEPFSHQRELFERTRHPTEGASRYVPVFWEQGAAKTKWSIDDASDLFLRGFIDCVIVVAPSGVHSNWDTDELPKHCPDRVLAQSARHVWRAAKAATKTHRQAAEALLNHSGLSWLFISYDAFMTDAGKSFVWKLLQKKKRRVAYYLDESSAIKSSSAKRTKSIVASGKYARYRRILDGTPVPNGPFDIWEPMKFLDSTLWARNGFASRTSFLKYFGEYENEEFVGVKLGAEASKYLRPKLKTYRRLDKLNLILDKEGASRVLKEDVFDLPPKLYSKRYFDLSPKARSMYEELREDYVTFLDNGEMVEASLTITRLLRLQQITCGYLPSEEEEGLVFIDDRNPRVDLLKETVEYLPHPAIIWARFTQDVDQIMDALASMGKEACRYDGQVDEEQRDFNKQAFNRGEFQFFVSKPQVGGTGLTLHRAKTEVFYNNDFNLRNRLQAEDRAHRAGMDEHPVNIIDLQASNTIDGKITGALRSKFDVASQITGDRLREWL